MRAGRCDIVSEDQKDQKPGEQEKGEQPKRSILVTLLVAAAIALLAGFLAWGVPVLLKAGAREDAQDNFAVLGFDSQDSGEQGAEQSPQAMLT
jgi:flagellar basal body-associated protein FliL